MERFYIYGEEYNALFKKNRHKWKARFYKKLHHSSGWSFPRIYQTEIENELKLFSINHDDKSIEQISIDDKSIEQISIDDDRSTSYDIDISPEILTFFKRYIQV